MCQGRSVGHPGTHKTTELSSPQPLSEVSVFMDSVTFRVAPWIMTPNTQPPLELYVCR